MAKKLTPTQKVKCALAQLDNAVQEWYQENNPDSKDRYACASIFETDEGQHVSRITLEKTNNFFDITSNKDWLGD